MDDTIAAIATAQGVGAIAIIRVSGTEAISIVNKTFRKHNLLDQPSHTIHYGHIVDGEKTIDEVLISIMRAPKSFTTEDVVEINAHGGIAATNKILELLLMNGCRLAEPGEFTKRAFLNGRIDLIEAEGVMDLISAKTEKSHFLALNQVTGTVSLQIVALREELAKIITNIEVNIDYPEYEDINRYENSDLVKQITGLKEKLKVIIKNSINGKVIKEGINVCLVGRPNVGKSSILNRLLEEEKAIVTDVAGTTRDIVEGQINLDGLLINILDTAGIRKTTDLVEAIGVDKSLALMEKADLILLVLNNNEEITSDDINLLAQIKGKNHIVIINKIDLDKKISISLENYNVVYLSSVNNTGFEELKSNIKNLFNLEKIEQTDLTYLSSARSIALAREALISLDEVSKGLSTSQPIDILEIDLKNCWNLLGQITGQVYQDELLDELFARFCLGK